MRSASHSRNMRASSQKSRAPAERPAKAPQRGRGRKRVAALLDAGAKVFAAEGYEAATMTAIAAAAGASIGSLYQFFPTKEHLAAALHARQLEALARTLDALLAETRGAAPKIMVDRLLEALVAFLEANPAFVVLADRRSIDPAVKKQVRARLRGRLAALMAAAVPAVPARRRAPLAAVMLHLMRVAALLRADDDASIRKGALAELATMLRRHLAGAA
jgi:AcrR family transcriptional regulator